MKHELTIESEIKMSVHNYSKEYFYDKINIQLVKTYQYLLNCKEIDPRPLWGKNTVLLFLHLSWLNFGRERNSFFNFETKKFIDFRLIHIKI